MSGGIRLQHDGVDIRMTPYTADSGKVTASPSAVLSSDSKRIAYALSEKVRYMMLICPSLNAQFSESPVTIKP